MSNSLPEHIVIYKAITLSDGTGASVTFDLTGTTDIANKTYGDISYSLTSFVDILNNVFTDASFVVLDDETMTKQKVIELLTSYTILEDGVFSGGSGTKANEDGEVVITNGSTPPETLIVFRDNIARIDGPTVEMNVSKSLLLHVNDNVTGGFEFGKVASTTGGVMHAFHYSQSESDDYIGTLDTSNTLVNTSKRLIDASFGSIQIPSDGKMSLVIIGLTTNSSIMSGNIDNVLLNIVISEGTALGGARVTISYGNSSLEFTDTLKTDAPKPPFQIMISFSGNKMYALVNNTVQGTVSTQSLNNIANIRNNQLTSVDGGLLGKSVISDFVVFNDALYDGEDTTRAMSIINKIINNSSGLSASTLPPSGGYTKYNINDILLGFVGSTYPYVEPAGNLVLKNSVVENDTIILHDSGSFSLNGNVAINTSTKPTSAIALDVNGDIQCNKGSFNGDIDITGAGKLSMDGIVLIENTGNKETGDFYYNCRVIRNANNFDNDGMHINYNSAGGTAADCRFFANGTTQRMVIKADSGNVGIGTDDPQSKLHVDGDIRCSGFGSFNGGGFNAINSPPGVYLGAASNAYGHLQIVSSNSNGGWIDFTDNIGTNSTDFEGRIRYGTSGTDAGMTFLTNGDERMRIGVAGNVGIGTNSPQSKLHVNGDIRCNSGSFNGNVNITNTHNLDVNGNINISGAGKLLMDGFTLINAASTGDFYYNCRVIRNSDTTVTSKNDGMYINFDSAGGTAADCRFFANGKNQRMVIKADSGNVGIGTTDPQSKLHVNGIARFNNGVNVGGSVSVPNITVGQTANTITSSADLILQTPNAKTVHIKGDLLVDGAFSFVGEFIKKNTNVQYTDQFEIVNAGTGPALVVTQSGNNDIVKFNDENGSVFVIKDNRNVGIGTDDPQSKLHVDGDIRCSGFGSFNGGGFNSINSPPGVYLGAASNAYGHLQIVSSNSNGGWIDFTDNIGTNSTDFEGRIRYGTSGTDAGMTFLTNGDERMRIGVAGNVGIGTNSPQSKLHVNGDIQCNKGSFNSDIDITGAGRLSMDGIVLIQNNSNREGGDFYYNCRVIRNADNFSDDGMYINHNSAGGTAADCRFFANGTSQRMVIKANSGNVGIATGSPSEKLHVNGNVKCINLTASGLVTGASFNATSDERTKTDISRVSRKVINKVLMLESKQFTFKSDDKHRTRYGFIAQEVEKILPELVSGENDEIKSIDYMGIIGPLLEQVKTLTRELEDMKQEFADMKQELAK